MQRDGLVRPIDEEISHAFHLLSLCRQLKAPDNEFYIQHYWIDSQGRGGSSQQCVLLITTSRVVFGSLEPAQVSFEIKLERMMRVDMPKPYNRIIIWTWQKLPRLFSIHHHRLAGEYLARPNAIIEREIMGVNPAQLKAACDHLKHLAQQVEELSIPHATRRHSSQTGTQLPGMHPQGH